MRTYKDGENFKTWFEKQNEIITTGVTGSFTNDPDLTSGLSFYIRGGTIRNNSTYINLADVSVALPDNAVSFVYVDTTPTLEQITNALEGALPASNAVVLYRVTTASGAITITEDYRSWPNAQYETDHAVFPGRDAVGAHDQYEYRGTAGYLKSLLMCHMTMISEDGMKVLHGDFNYLMQSNSTYVDRYGVVQHATYYTGTPTAHDAYSVSDTGATLGDLSGYVIYLTDGVNEAYRWVDSNTATSVLWKKVISFAPTTYKLSKPRFEKEGLLIEGASTNLLTYSEQFDNAIWTKSNATITADATTAPDGTTTADKLVEDVATSGHYVEYTIARDSTLESAWSVWIKAAGRTDVIVIVYDASNLANYLTFQVDVGTGTIVQAASSNGAGQIYDWVFEKHSNGWYRVGIGGIVGDSTGGNLYCRVQMVNGSTTYTGDGTSGVYLWGGQLEPLSFPTSYISTTTAAGSRLAEYIVIENSLNHPSIRDEFSVVIDSSTLSTGQHTAARTIFATGLGEAGVDSYNVLQITSSSTNVDYSRSATGMTVKAGNIDQNSRFGISVDSNDTVKTYLDGVIVSTATHALATETGLDAIHIGIGQDTAGNQSLYGHVSNFKIYGKALSENEMRVA